MCYIMQLWVRGCWGWGEELWLDGKVLVQIQSMQTFASKRVVFPDYEGAHLVHKPLNELASEDMHG